jgi:hypothetical protein
MQREHVQEAVRNPALAARANGGHPPIAATPRATAYTAPGVVGARGAAPAAGAGRFNNGAATAPNAVRPHPAKPAGQKPRQHTKPQPEKRDPQSK